ncbi:hypothetical protein DYB32_005677 [Aphanomyces invadans]|uniref:Methyltransferase domain-containing protein n=1 Tax=Aphanomyces invadans TaxID=157072 RepID=A0A3R6Y7L2_9STRA|nr:hypothetical protein DYB32_005677 [Aphanomyces invadans]
MLAGRRSFWSSAKSALTKGKETISRISKINQTADIVDGISSIGLNQVHVFPEPLRQRVSTLLKERTQVQLEKLKETITLGTSKSRFPWDSHNEQIGWEMDKKSKIPEFLYGPQETMAYMAFEMDGVFSAVHHVLRQMTNVDGEAAPFRPKSMLDFGAGPGTASWVAKEFFDESLNEYRLVEPSQSMMDAAAVVMEGFRGLSFRKSLSEMKREIVKGKQYDLIVVSFVLSDITNDFERIAVMSTLWSLLAENGRLVIVDRGGTMERRSVTKGRAERDVYRAARKAHWGSQWPATKESYELPKVVHPPKRRKKMSAKKLAARAGKLVADV